MKDIITVFGFTLRDNIRKKTFIITTVIVLVLILAACSLPTIFSGSKGDKGADVTPGEKKSNTCYVLDQNNLVPGAISALTEAYPNIEFKKGESGKTEEYKKTIEGDKSVAMLEIIKGEPIPSLRFTVTDFMSGVPTDGMAQVVRQVIVADVLSKAGVSEADSRLVLTDISYTTVPAGKMDVTGYSLGIVLTLLMFFAVYFYGYGVAMSVASKRPQELWKPLSYRQTITHTSWKMRCNGVLGLIQLTIFILAGAGDTACLFRVISQYPACRLRCLLHPAFRRFDPCLFPSRLFAVCDDQFGLRATVSQAEDLQSP